MDLRDCGQNRVVLTSIKGKVIPSLQIVHSRKSELNVTPTKDKQMLKSVLSGKEKGTSFINTKKKKTYFFTFTQVVPY